MSVDGKKVLHMDRNDYYGGASASVNLQQLFERFNAGEPNVRPAPRPRGEASQRPHVAVSCPAQAALGSSRDFNIDLAPKFIMASGKLVKMLVMTSVNRYLEFRQVDGSYVLKDGRVPPPPPPPPPPTWRNSR